MLKKLYYKLRDFRNKQLKKSRIKSFHRNRKIPWSIGYEDYKWEQIEYALNDSNIQKQFSARLLEPGYGKGLDERIVEYPWVFSNLKKTYTKLLDAGSTFNFTRIIEHPLIRNKELSICTYFPESINFVAKRISYLYSDLRNLPFRNNWFEEIVCISTLEHIGMDNTIYGYSEDSSGHKTNAFIDAVSELIRVVKPDGQILITVPFGRYHNYGYFQQFDSDMIQAIADVLKDYGETEFTFFKYDQDGWRFSNKSTSENSFAFNPHTGEGKGEDGAAHSRAVCCLRFIKNN